MLETTATSDLTAIASEPFWALLLHHWAALLTAALLFFVPPLMGGMVLATSKRTKDRKFPLGAYPSWPEGRVWW